MLGQALALLAALSLCVSGYACRSGKDATIKSVQQKSGITARLQAVFAVDSDVVWASGVEGSVLRTIDGGVTWSVLRVPDAEELQFRDVHAFDDQHAFLLSAGDGELSRIYRTRDGGENWSLQFAMTEASGFLDCFDFWDMQNGIAYGDSIDGELYLLKTVDGGATWKRVAPTGIPKAEPGEGGFAASGTCVRVAAEGKAWVGTGAGGNARVLRSSDWGETFQASKVPVVTGESAGVMSVVRLGPSVLALGGDLSKPDEKTNNVAISEDEGRTWKLASAPEFPGAVYGAAATAIDERSVLVAVGPKGVDLSLDHAQSWTPLDRGDFWSVDFGGARRFWAVGSQGRIMRFELPDRVAAWRATP